MSWIKDVCSVPATGCALTSPALFWQIWGWPHGEALWHLFCWRVGPAEGFSSVLPGPNTRTSALWSAIALHAYAFGVSPRIVVVYRSFEKFLLAGRIDETKQSFVCRLSAECWITGSATLTGIKWNPFRPMVRVCHQSSPFLWRLVNRVWRWSFSTDPGSEWAGFWRLLAFILALQRSLHACAPLCFRCWTPWPPRRGKWTHSSRNTWRRLPENVCLRLSDVNKRRVPIPESFWWCCSSTEWFVGYTEVQAILCCRSTAREYRPAPHTPPPGVLLLPDAWKRSLATVL